MRRRVLPLLLLLVIVAAACDVPDIAPPGDGPTRYRDPVFDAAQAQGLPAFLETWDGTCHVPYPEHRQQILDQSRNFLFWEMDLSHAAT